MLNKILELKKIQGKSRKFIGALTTELIRTELLKQRFNVSNSNVFFEGIPNELDFFEIKFRGAYGKNKKIQLKKYSIILKEKMRIENV